MLAFVILAVMLLAGGAFAYHHMKKPQHKLCGQWTAKDSSIKISNDLKTVTAVIVKSPEYSYKPAVAIVEKVDDLTLNLFSYDEKTKAKAAAGQLKWLNVNQAQYKPPTTNGSALVFTLVKPQ